MEMLKLIYEFIQNTLDSIVKSQPTEPYFCYIVGLGIPITYLVENRILRNKPWLVQFAAALLTYRMLATSLTMNISQDFASLMSDYVSRIPANAPLVDAVLLFLFRIMTTVIMVYQVLKYGYSTWNLFSGRWTASFSLQEQEQSAENSFRAMSENNPTPNTEWVRLNVGGKVFQTTKSTLSTYPESFLARLANGNIPSEKDQSGAFLIDRNYEHFGSILNYFRNAVVNLDRNEKATKDLLCEADFYNIQPLVHEIQKTMSPIMKRSETVLLSVNYKNDRPDKINVTCSEKHADYEVLQALKAEFNFEGNNGKYKYNGRFPAHNQRDIEMVLRNFGFVQESYDDNYYEDASFRVKCWKFVRMSNDTSRSL